MKVIFECSRDEMFKYLNEPYINNTVRNNISGVYERDTHKSDTRELNKRAVFVPLEIRVSALERLIRENYLVAEELHCRDKSSKDVVRKAILDALFKP